MNNFPSTLRNFRVAFLPTFVFGQHAGSRQTIDGVLIEMRRLLAVSRGVRGRGSQKTNAQAPADDDTDNHLTHT
jgi:hypothetical protein